MEYNKSTSLIDETVTRRATQYRFFSRDKAYGMRLLYEMMLIRRFEEKSAALYTKERSVDFFICM